MLRLAACMGSRSGLRLSTLRASRNVRMRCMRFATHGRLQGIPFGDARLFYLAAMRPSLQLQYSVNWQGRMQMMPDVSASFFERVVHTRVISMLERLYAKLALASRVSHGRDALQGRVVDLWRERLHQPFPAESPSMHDASAAGTPLLAEQGVRRPLFVFAQGPGWRQLLDNMARPATRPERGMRESNLRIDASRTLLRFVLTKLHILRVSAQDRVHRARYAAAGAAAAFNALRVHDRFVAMVFSPHANGPSQFFFGPRVAETSLKPLRLFHASHGMDYRADSVLARYLRANTGNSRGAEAGLKRPRLFHASRGVNRRAGSVLAHYLLTHLGMTTRGAGWPLAPFIVRELVFSRLRLALSRMPFSATSRERGLSAAAPEQAATAKPDIESRPMRDLLQFAHVPGETPGTHNRLFASRLSINFRQGIRWRTRMSSLARQLQITSATGAERPDAGVSAFPSRHARQGQDRSPLRTARTVRRILASRPQELSLVPLHASGHAGQTLVALSRGQPSGLVTAYTRGNPPPATMAYRETPRPSELPGIKLMQRIEQQITRKIVHDITQATPWRGDMEKAVLTPRLMRELAEQVGGMLTQRIGLERYRRGL